jgi:hypothetical protein
MKRLVATLLILSLGILTALAKEEPPPNSILVYTCSSHGYKYAHAGMHAKREMEIKVEHGAQLDIIPLGKSGTWVAEARSPKDKVKISIQVYDDKGKLVASADGEGKKLVGTITKDKPVVICLDERKD